MSSKRLGKGLEALIRPAKKREEAPAPGAILIPLKSIKENPHQPRKIFDSKKMEEMADSIREKGIITPITVKEDGDQFILVAGERRLRAAKLAKVKSIPAYRITVKDDAELLEMALIENIQREKLNSIEEAEAFALLQSKFNLNQTEIAKSIGKKRVTVSNSLRLLTLPREILESLRINEISAGHGRAILMVKLRREKLKLWEKIKREQMSVRAVEKWVKEKINRTGSQNQLKLKKKYPPGLLACENEMIELLGTKVKLKPSKDGGTILVHYFSDEDLERIMDMWRSIE
ncbi:MAG: ParB/RepB/Spo0J family partition protein [Candidatus Marinimicrobia bacterium]|nr:ParB/RepB/Spo0J family partition protein [Candidatus Neomarinimicrobiota bacterium]